MRCIVNMLHGLPRLACNARLTRTQHLDRQSTVRSENRGVYTLVELRDSLRAPVLDPDLFAVAELSRAPRLVTQVEMIKAWDGFYIQRLLQTPEPEHYLNCATRCYSHTLLFS
jgi:hypothetical protein